MSDKLPNEYHFYTPELTDEEAVTALVALANRNEPFNQTRKQQAIKYASLIENMTLSSLGPYGYTAADKNPYFEDESGTRIPIVRNTANAILEGFLSWIGATDTPKPTFITTEGNWKDKRKAEQLRKLCEATYKDEQGKHQDTYELCQHALRLAAGATGAAAVKVCVYPNETKIVHELKDTLDLYVDYGEASTGDILTIGDKTWIDPERLCAIYPGFETQIYANLDEPPQEKNIDQVGYRIKSMVALYEGWRVSITGVPGRYVCGLKDGTCFVNDEYDYPSAPFAFFTFTPRMWGMWGHSMTHFIYESVFRDNAILSTIDTAVSRTNFSEVFFNPNDLVDPTSMERIKDGMLIEVKDVNKIPVHKEPKGFHEAHLSLAEQHRQDAHALSGMPEAKTGSKAEPGISSAIGQRNVAAFVNKRFAGPQGRYIKFAAVDIAKLDIRAMREVQRRDGGFSKKWNGGKFLEELDDDSLNLDDDRFVISCEPVSQNKNTPADRVQAAELLYQTGAISADTFAVVSEDFDTPDAIRDDSVQVKWLDREMYKWCYASDNDIEKPDFYRGPIKFMNLDVAVLKVIDGLLQAQMENLEDERQWFFMTFLSDLDAQIKARAAYIQSIQTTPQAPQGELPLPANTIRQLT